jgi:hypothetical protein
MKTIGEMMMSKNIKRGWKKSLLLKAIVLQFGMFGVVGAQTPSSTTTPAPAPYLCPSPTYHYPRLIYNNSKHPIWLSPDYASAGSVALCQVDSEPPFIDPPCVKPDRDLNTPYDTEILPGATAWFKFFPSYSDQKVHATFYLTYRGTEQNYVKMAEFTVVSQDDELKYSNWDELATNVFSVKLQKGSCDIVVSPKAIQ